MSPAPLSVCPKCGYVRKAMAAAPDWQRACLNKCSAGAAEVLKPLLLSYNRLRKPATETSPDSITAVEPG